MKRRVRIEEYGSNLSGLVGTEVATFNHTVEDDNETFRGTTDWSVLVLDRCDCVGWENRIVVVDSKTVVSIE
jgi:hypothetical protein